MKPDYRFLVFSIFVLLIFSAACSQISSQSNDSQILQTQVSALQTQNALLLDDRNNGNSDATSQNIGFPETAITETPSLLNTNEPTQESLPTSPVPAGKPISYDGWVMTVDPNIVIRNYGSYFGFNILIRNIESTTRIFRFQNSGISINDDLGNVYDPSEACFEDLYISKNLDIEPEQTKEIQPVPSYCGGSSSSPAFIAPVNLNANQLIITFTDFGPFKNVQVFVDL